MPVTTTRRNPLERRGGEAVVLVSTTSTLTAADLRYDYGQVDQASREGVIAAALDIRTHAARAKDSMIKIGLKLASVKGLLPHGQFSDWCETEFEMSQRSAQRMMQAAEVFGSKSDTVSLLSDSAMYLLSGPSVPEAAREEIVIEAQATGKSPTKGQVQMAIKKHKSPATERRIEDQPVPQKAPAPATITLTFALLGDEAERKAQYDWFKQLEQTTLAAYMQALYQTNGEL